jgi:hypothetical protein
MSRHFQRLFVVLLCGLLWVAKSSRAQEGVDPAQEQKNETAAQREVLKQLATLMERDWNERPEWAQMATAVLAGDSMGHGKGWFKPSQSRYDWPWLVARFDQDKSEAIERTEMSCDDDSFRRLDRDQNGILTAGDLDWTSGTGRNDSAARLASLLTFRLDADSNGKITSAEWAAFFALVDGEQAGYFTPEELQAVLSGPRSPPAGAAGPSREFRPGADPFDDLKMLLSGQFGSLTSGPLLNQPAPEFTLPRHDGSGAVTLSQLRGKPVVLIFGSFT